MVNQPFRRANGGGRKRTDALPFYHLLAALFSPRLTLVFSIVAKVTERQSPPLWIPVTSVQISCPSIHTAVVLNLQILQVLNSVRAYAIGELNQHVYNLLYHIIIIYYIILYISLCYIIISTARAICSAVCVCRCRHTIIEKQQSFYQQKLNNLIIINDTHSCVGYIQ